ncbi:MAG: VWA domain-containing protein, partial [Gemmatimonadota bacterium]
MSAGVRFSDCGSGRWFGRFGARLAATAAGAISAAFLLSLAAFAQTEPLQITAVSDEAWPAVEVTLTAFGQDGQPLTGLVQEDFAATLAGEPLPPTSLRTTSDAGLGIAIVLTFDVSGSMAGSPLEQARLAGRALIEQLGGDDQAAVVTFASSVQIVQHFTADR